MIVDANIFLEVMLRQQYYDDCKVLLDELRNGDREGVVTAYHADAVAYILGETSESTSSISSFLASLMMYDGLAVHNQSVAEKLLACRTMEATGLDFDDSLAVQAAESTDSDRIVTLDDDFDSIETVQSVHPSSL